MEQGVNWQRSEFRLGRIRTGLESIPPCTRRHLGKNKTKQTNNSDRLPANRLVKEERNRELLETS